jgi:small subunit ribosomal protein S20
VAEGVKKSGPKRNKSAQKQARQAVRRRARNRIIKSKISSLNKKMQAAPEQRAALVREAYTEIDRAAKKGMIHKRAAARRKSRLAKLANKKTA